MTTRAAMTSQRRISVGVTRSLSQVDAHPRRPAKPRHGDGDGGVRTDGGGGTAYTHGAAGGGAWRSRGGGGGHVSSPLQGLCVSALVLRCLLVQEVTFRIRRCYYRDQGV